MTNQPIPAPTVHVRQQNGGNNGNGNNNGNGQQPTAAAASVAATSSIPDSVPAGLITITQPPQTATSFYKIAPSQPITFAWNFTDLLITQTSLTLSAVGENGYTYPVGPTNGQIPGTATSVVWDAWSYNQNAGSSPTLGMGAYNLKIWGDLGPDAVRSPGQLQPNSALQFALYTTQPYTPLSSWKCTTCNAALSLAYQPVFLCMMVTFAVMFLSGWRVIRR
ncbi:hypothetical protein PILCRDRAFT_78052 [Piloderma croceum F 1598]|uniref:DUF7137 domain-containing protein n=1 Tax=Piloderma croceum (strain F 1598) TaxID=765440 RepID=A0A0C3BFS1_PILCF|nr:hypothetical protein PILCRDRAFT_78052 [Piloderma croceum F 1598]